MDEAIPYLLYVYGAVLFVLVASPQRKWLQVLFVAALPLRLICNGLRTSIGSDIDSYTAVLQQCDLSSINAIEVFWLAACLPSSLLDGVVPFPFLWVGLLDCVLIFYVAKLAGWRVAALHDLIYLQTTSMGAIRQALAMKLVVIAVLLYRNNKRQQAGSSLILTTPFVHLGAVIPAAVIKFTSATFTVRLGVIIVLAVAATQLVDDALLGKLAFYLEFEGFRTAQDMYASWVKRGFVIGSAALLTNPARAYWGLYAAGLLFAALEFYVPEIAVRIGAYFEQFEVFLVAAPMRRRWRQLGVVWYTAVAVAYTTRYMANVANLPR